MPPAAVGDVPEAGGGADGGAAGAGCGTAESQPVKSEAHAANAGSRSPGGGGGGEDAGEAREAGESARAAEVEAPVVGFFMYQRQADRLYQHVYVQVFVASLICANFVANMVEKQIDPTEAKYPEHFKNIGTFFNIAFAVELALNMYSSWLCGFWRSGWNCFDFLVVTIGILTEVEAPMPGPLNKLRMMRAFRIFRLFKRVASLNRILTSLLGALPGVFNAFLILILVMSIYAIMAVELFRDRGEQCLVECMDGPLELCEFPVTSRMMCIGPDLFGTFFQSFYSLFQVLTHESWSEAVTRPLFATPFVRGPIEPLVALQDIGTGIFFSSFVIINSVVLINVVVAVLLDQMCGESTDGADPNPPEGCGDESLRNAGLASEEPWVPGVRREVDALQAELQRLHDDFTTVVAEANSGVEQMRADVLAMWRQLDDMLELARELSATPNVARRRV